MTRKTLLNLIAKTSMVRIRRNDAGNMAIEFAFILPIALVLLAGLVEFGVIANDRSSIEAAARAGAQFAFSGGYNANKVDAAVRAASPIALGQSDTVTSKVFCECTDKTAITCGNVCTNGGPNRRFIEVAVTKKHKAWLPFMASLLPDQVSASSTIRIQ